MRFGLDSEFSQLNSVLLYIPGKEIADHPSPATIQHLAPINYAELSRQLAAVIDSFSLHGIETCLIPQPDDPADCSNYNMMFCRDLLFMTPAGAIMASMAHETRRSEVSHAVRTLLKEGIPILSSVSGNGRFEGADALWINKNLVIVGVGNRTNLAGYQQVKKILASIGIETVALPSTQQKTQHLLGSLQIVAKDLALVRTELVAGEVVSFLVQHGFKVVGIPENPEVRSRQAMNIVTVAPRQVIMTANCPETKQSYLDAGIEIIAELEITQLINGAGGLACATGTLARNSA